MDVSVARTSLVVPAKPIREHWLPLSNLDRVVMPTYVRVLLVYGISGAEKRSYAEVLQTLKYSLARVLVDFYPMAGRLGVQDDGLVNLHCNGAGAIFSEACANQPLNNVELASHMSALSGMDVADIGPGPLYVPSREMQIPALVIQVHTPPLTPHTLFLLSGLPTIAPEESSVGESLIQASEWQGQGQGQDSSRSTQLPSKEGVDYIPEICADSFTLSVAVWSPS